MKQMEVTEKQIGENIFYLKPFPAFVAVNISGELAAILTPMLGGVAALVGTKKPTGELGAEIGGEAGDSIGGILDANIEDALPVLSQAFSGLSGDKFERLMKKLLIDSRNVSVEGEATDGNVKTLTYDLANEVFCGDVQDMYILCFEVIKLNFSGFFKKLGAQFGSLKDLFQKETPSTKSGEN